MRTAEALWMANRDGQAAIALAPLAAEPRRLDLRGAEAVLGLADGGTLRLADADAAGIGGVAESVGRVSIFEVDARGTVRRATLVDVARALA